MPAMTKGARKSTRYDVSGLSPARPTRWRSHDLKGPLPRATARALEIAIRSLPVRAPWPEIGDDGWWKAVLADRRLRQPTAKSLAEKAEYAGQRLDRLPVKALTFSCEWCGQRAKLKVDDLILMFGRDRNVRSIWPPHPQMQGQARSPRGRGMPDQVAGLERYSTPSIDSTRRSAIETSAVSPPTAAFSSSAAT
jgi:hypothetical protein